MIVWWLDSRWWVKRFWIWLLACGFHVPSRSKLPLHLWFTYDIISIYFLSVTASETLSFCRYCVLLLSFCGVFRMPPWLRSSCRQAEQRGNSYAVIVEHAVLIIAIISYLLLLHYYTRLTALCPGLPGWASTRKVKPVWILLKQETVSGSGISWAVCKPAPCSRQITTPAPHHCPSCRSTNSVKALKDHNLLLNQNIIVMWQFV